MKTLECEEENVKVDIDERIDTVIITINNSILDTSYHSKIIKMLREDSQFMKTNSKKVASLSEREKEVFCLVVMGYSSQMIADELYISKHTAQTHRKRLNKKLNIKSQKDILTYARVFGFI